MSKAETWDLTVWPLDLAFCKLSAGFDTDTTHLLLRSYAGFPAQLHGGVRSLRDRCIVERHLRMDEIMSCLTARVDVAAAIRDDVGSIYLLGVYRSAPAIAEVGDRGDDALDPIACFRACWSPIRSLTRPSNPTHRTNWIGRCGDQSTDHERSKNDPL